jgi:sulfur carrier protein ThiS
MTVQDVLDQHNYVYEGLIIRINDRLVEDRNHPILDGDSVKVIHICQGG